MNLTARTYCPRSGSIPAQVIHFFQQNLSQSMTGAKIGLKFNTPAAGVFNSLTPAVEAGFLDRTGGVYTAGDDIDQAPNYGSVAQADATIKAAGSTQGAHSPFAAVPAYKARATAAKRASHSAINFEAFVIEDDVAMIGGTRGAEKWAPLLDRLTKPGQSAVIDPAMKGAIYAAAKSRQAKGNGKYKAGTDLQGKTRLWRTE